MGYQERTDLAKLRRTKAQLPVQPVYYPYVDSKNLEVLSAELGFGRMHHRPNIKDALKDINRPQCSNRCSEEAYTLAYDFCREKGQGLWPDTYGRTWPSWLNDSELYVSLLALIFKSLLILSGSSILLPTFFHLTLTGKEPSGGRNAKRMKPAPR